jgi:predicted KAP-like P-loop ATPase
VTVSDSIDQIWADDLLGRRADADLLTRFLLARTAERKAEGRVGSYVLNLNASWGQGKTFFIEHLARQLRSQGHLVSYVNSWRDDASGEPLVAVMAAIELTLKPHLTVQSGAEKIWRAAKSAGGEALLARAKGIAKRVITKVIGDGVQEIIEIYHDAQFDEVTAPEPSVSSQVDGSGKDGAMSKAEEKAAETITAIADRLMSERLESYRRRASSIDAFKANMSRLIERLGSENKIQPPFFIFIDELDRCRPNYAIEMIEQVKHLFDIDGVVFVVSTDTEQLSNSISAVYGQSFDGQKYLLRFFNRQYAFDPPSTEHLCRYLFESSGIETGKLSAPLDMSSWMFFQDQCLLLGQLSEILSSRLIYLGMSSRHGVRKSS